jgi:hypothetical protein
LLEIFVFFLNSNKDEVNQVAVQIPLNLHFSVPTLTILEKNPHEPPQHSRYMVWHKKKKKKKILPILEKKLKHKNIILLNMKSIYSIPYIMFHIIFIIILLILTHMLPMLRVKVEMRFDNIPDSFLPPRYHPTVGAGLAPRTSHVPPNVCPSLSGPSVVEFRIGLPSSSNINIADGGTGKTKKNQ